MIQRGYATDFIGNGITVPVPGFSPRIAGLVLKNPELRDEIYADYVHYSLVMNKQTKQLIF